MVVMVLLQYSFSFLTNRYLKDSSYVGNYLELIDILKRDIRALKTTDPGQPPHFPDENLWAKKGK